LNIEQNKTVMRNFLIELDKSTDAIERFFASDCMAHLPGSDSPVSRDGFKAFVGMLYTAFPDLRHTIVEQVAENDKVANVVRADGAHKGVFLNVPPTGKVVVIKDIFIVRIMEGKVVELWAQFDILGLLQQLGVDE
jgi:steroid delta-isomerase-like uncharacterized protein